MHYAIYAFDANLIICEFDFYAKNDFYANSYIFVAGLDEETDLLMIITSFGIFVYSTFTIVAGGLNDNSYEPPELVVVNGLAELLQVVILYIYIYIYIC